MASIESVSVTPAVTRHERFASRGEGLLDREGVLGYLLMTPALLLLVVFIAYPFALGVWYSMSDVKIVGLGEFIGVKNYADLLQSPVFQQTIKNSFVYTVSATVFKLALGLGLA